MPTFRLIRLLLLSLAFIAAPSLAQTGSLSGRVVDADKPSHGISPVDVDLLDPVTGTRPIVYTGRTDSGGYYEITNIPVGDYKVIFNAFDSANNYIDELYDGLPCDDGNCDRAVSGDTVSISEGDNTLNVSLRNSNPGPSREQVAAIVLLLNRGQGVTGFESIYFNYDPENPQFATIGVDGTTRLDVLADKSTGNLISEVVLTSGADAIKAGSILFDSRGRPTKMTSIFGEATLAYPGDGSVQITSVNTAGEEVIFTVDEPAAFGAASKSASAKDSACSALDPLLWRTRVGKAVFACDNAFTEDAYTENGELVPLSLSATYEPRDPSRPAIRLDEAARGEAPIVLGLPTDPSTATHTYNYSVRVPVRAPSFEDWNACCSSFMNELAGVTSISLFLIDIGGTYAVTSCAATLALSGVAAPGCAASVIAFGIGQALEAAFVDDITSDDSVRACARQEYEKQKESAFNPDFYRNAYLTFTKRNVRGGVAEYVQAIDLLEGYFTGGEIDTVTLGPVPAQFRNTIFGEGSEDGIYAFRETGERLLLLNGQVFARQSDGSFVETAVEVGERLSFRAIDQFFNRGGDEVRLDAQYYGCATYTWSLFRNDARIGNPYVQPADERAVLTDPLDSGNYEIEVCADNSKLQKGYTASAYFSNGQDIVETSLGPDCESETFTVGSDDDIIRAHLVGTWDVWDDLWVFSTDDSADGGYGSACWDEYQDDVFVKNPNIPEGGTIDVYKSLPRSNRMTLFEDGTGSFRYYNSDGTPINAKGCTNYVLDPPERANSFRWSVNNGRVSLIPGYATGVRGFLTIDRLFESYDADTYDFFTISPFYPDQYGSRFRLQRVSSP